MTIVYLSVSAYFLTGGLACFLIVADAYKRGLEHNQKDDAIALALISILLWPVIGLFIGIAGANEWISCTLDCWFKKTYGKK